MLSGETAEVGETGRSKTLGNRLAVPHWIARAAPYAYPLDENSRYQVPVVGRQMPKSVRPSPSKSAAIGRSPCCPHCVCGRERGDPGSGVLSHVPVPALKSVSADLPVAPKSAVSGTDR